jgi:hypothetical protein
MLKLSDLGCNEHKRRQITLSGIEAELMEGILYNLHQEGDFHTFICKYGHTHRISFYFEGEKCYQSVANFQ